MPPGAWIEVDGNRLGRAPLTLVWRGPAYRDGVFGDRGHTIAAFPSGAGQKTVVRGFPGGAGGGGGKSLRIPERIVFEMVSPPEGVPSPEMVPSPEDPPEGLLIARVASEAAVAAVFVNPGPKPPPHDAHAQPARPTEPARLEPAEPARPGPAPAPTLIEWAERGREHVVDRGAEPVARPIATRISGPVNPPVAKPAPTPFAGRVATPLPASRGTARTASRWPLPRPRLLAPAEEPAASAAPERYATAVLALGIGLFVLSLAASGLTAATRSLRERMMQGAEGMADPEGMPGDRDDEPSRSDARSARHIRIHARHLYALHCAVLGLPPDASFPTVERRYRELVFRYHPDKNGDIHAAGTFNRIARAYETLETLRRTLSA